MDPQPEEGFESARRAAGGNFDEAVVRGETEEGRLLETLTVDNVITRHMLDASIHV